MTRPSNPANGASRNTDEIRKQVRWRQTLIIIFAIALLFVTSVSSAQSPPASMVQYGDAPLQYDAMTPAVASPSDAFVDPARVAGGAIHGVRLRGDARPAYVEFAAALSNFDADADPDGWRAELVLLNRKDRPVVMRSRATFELMPRVATADHHHFVDANRTPIRWSMPLEFDEDGVARVKLPLRESLQPLLGVSRVYPHDGSRTRDYGHSALGLRSWSRTRSFVTLDLRQLIGTPSTGEMRVRVSVPTEGVFEAATPVWIRPPVLVDTQWPYR